MKSVPACLRSQRGAARRRSPACNDDAGHAALIASTSKPRDVIGDEQAALRTGAFTLHGEPHAEM